MLHAHSMLLSFFRGGSGDPHSLQGGGVGHPALPRAGVPDHTPGDDQRHQPGGERGQAEVGGAVGGASILILR